ncbi:MAG: pyridoxal phosphate-dependent class II aminotransferase [Deltaproteobacteria bacterium]|nr:pyridoxal phosphate-dependent class II aminotransferase [Deltaproteobacteria bacterium]
MSVHGGNIVATAKALGCQVADLIDMSGNLTPLGMAPGLREALTQGLEQVAFLPETESETLRQVFAGKFGLREDEVLAGNGTTEFIFALPASFGHKRAIIVNPTYSDYSLACSWANMPVVNFMLTLEHDFRLDMAHLAKHLQGEELVFICNPNNPTAGLTPTRELYALIVNHPATTFVVDESYLPFTREMSLLRYDLPANLFVLFSSSKIYGIPGLRLGFLAARAANLQALALHRKPWGVNRLAQIAGEYLLHNSDSYVEDVRQFVEQERPRFVKGLQEMGSIRVIPGAANFMLCYLQGDLSAAELRGRLLEKRIMIRDCASFAGLDDHYFRLCLQGREKNVYCLKVLREIFN